MRIFKQLAHLSAAALLTAAAVSCHDGDGLTPGTEPSREIEVSINAPATRTALLEDGLTARWVRGDRIALWAYTNGTAAFANAPFTLWYPREAPEQGLFTGMVGAMTAGTYDYYASYPTPEATDGTKVTYTIPAVQDGTWNGNLDIMLAATQGTELKEEILNEITLQFHHKVHALKITIPEGRNLLGRPIEKLRIEFPQAVAGRMTWDLANPAAAPETAATENAITLDFATPVNEGDTFWVFVAPADLTGGEVRFVATDGVEYSWPLSAWNFRDCAEGRMTPVRLTIDERRPQQTYKLTVDPARLGEPVTEINRLTMPEGYEFPNIELSTTTRTITPNNDGTFSVRTFIDQAAALTAGMQASMTVGSENTEGVSGKGCEVRDVTADGCTIMAPYLFFEDFAETTACDTYADNDGKTAQEMTEARLPGWTGSRWKTEANTSLEFRTYIGSSTALGRQENKYGRVDTPPLPLRNGKTVTLSVSYDIGSTNNSKCTFGTTTQSGPIPGGRGYDNRNLPEKEVETFAPDTSGTPTNMPTHKQHTIENCGAGCRLTWFGTYNSGLVTAKTFYFYMDNVRVTIVR